MAINLAHSVAEAVRVSLASRGIQQKDAAVVLCLSQQAFSDRMRGRTPFTLADLERLPLLGIEIAEVLDPSTVSA